MEGKTIKRPLKGYQLPLLAASGMPITSKSPTKIALELRKAASPMARGTRLPSGVRKSGAGLTSFRPLKEGRTQGVGGEVGWISSKMDAMVIVGHISRRT